MIPPSILRLRIEEKGRSGIRLWLPLFLLWPLLLLVALFVLPFAVLVALFSFSLRRGLLTALEAYRLLCALRGLEIDVRNPEHALRIQVW